MKLVEVANFAEKIGVDVPQIFYNGNFNGWNQFRKTLNGENITNVFKK
jgi:hypothetical protein